EVAHRQSREAGQTMEEITASITRVTGIMQEIAAASDEQQSGIEHINQAMGQMDQITQQNAALVEEAAAATDSMRAQTISLSGTVAIFKLAARMDSRPQSEPESKLKLKPQPKPQRGTHQETRTNIH